MGLEQLTGKFKVWGSAPSTLDEHPSMLILKRSEDKNGPRDLLVRLTRFPEPNAKLFLYYPFCFFGSTVQVEISEERLFEKPKQLENFFVPYEGVLKGVFEIFKYCKVNEMEPPVGSSLKLLQNMPKEEKKEDKKEPTFASRVKSATDPFINKALQAGKYFGRKYTRIRSML